MIILGECSAAVVVNGYTRIHPLPTNQTQSSNNMHAMAYG
jgi:hypothetical protein